MPKGISHSRVEGYLSCRRKDWYGYQFPTDIGTGIKRQSEGTDSLSVGSAFHQVASKFYQAIKDGYLREVAIDAMWGEYTHIMEDGFENRGGNYVDLDVLISRWIDNETISEEYTILGVEEEFNLSTEDGDFPFIVDLRVSRGGVEFVVDHKTAYYLYTEEDIELMPQIPKYVGALRALGYRVAGGIYQVVRTQKVSGDRMLKADMVNALLTVNPDLDEKSVKKMLVPALEEACISYGIEPVKPVDPSRIFQVLELDLPIDRVTTTLREQFDTANEIRGRDEWPVEEQESRAYRTANKTVCKDCYFRLVCSEDLRGGNSGIVLLTYYEPKPKRDPILPSEDVD